MKFNKINWKIDIELFLINSSPYLICAFLVIAVSNSLTHVDRWVLLEQIAMADNYINNGNFYPEINKHIPTGVSAYFPGVAILAAFFRKISIDYYLVELMLIISLLILFFFIYLQTKIINMITSHKYDFYEIIPSVIFFLFFLCPDYYFYAIEFKPDTISFLLGYIGIFYLLRSNKKINYNSIIGILFLGSAILFKQQYVSLLLGLSLFSIVKYEKKRTLFVFCSIIVSSSIIWYLYFLESPWYWNVKVLSDDGWRNIFSVIDNDLYKTGINLFQLIIIIILVLDKNKITELLDKIKNGKLKLFLNNPWIYITVIAALTAFLSALKVGGNIGNIQFGLFLFFPIFFLLINTAPRYKLIALAWFVLIPEFKTLLNYEHYLKASQMRSYVNQMEIEPGSKVLTGSDSYYAARLLHNKGCEIDNYWAFSLKSNSLVYESLNQAIKLDDYEILIVENWPENLTHIQAMDNYEIIFENRNGIIAKKNNLQSSFWP